MPAVTAQHHQTRPRESWPPLNSAEPTLQAPAHYRSQAVPGPASLTPFLAAGCLWPLTQTSQAKGCIYK